MWVCHGVISRDKRKVAIFRPPDKREYLKHIFLISQSKDMLLVHNIFMTILHSTMIFQALIQANNYFIQLLTSMR